MTIEEQKQNVQFELYKCERIIELLERKEQLLIGIVEEYKSLTVNEQISELHLIDKELELETLKNEIASKYLWINMYNEDLENLARRFKMLADAYNTHKATISKICKELIKLDRVSKPDKAVLKGIKERTTKSISDANKVSDYNHYNEIVKKY